MDKNNSQAGFFKLLALIIIVIIILAIAGYDARGIWDATLRPIIEFIFNVIVKVFDLVVLVLTKAVGVFTGN